MCQSQQPVSASCGSRWSGFPYAVFVIAALLAVVWQPALAGPTPDTMHSGLEFRQITQLEDGIWRTQPEMRGGVATGYEQIIDAAGRPVSQAELKEKVFRTPPIVTGADMLPNASVEKVPPGWAVTFELRGDKKNAFEDYTATHVNKPLAIFFDGRLVSAPNINRSIPGKGLIETPSKSAALAIASQLNERRSALSLMLASTLIVASLLIAAWLILRTTRAHSRSMAES